MRLGLTSYTRPIKEIFRNCLAGLNQQRPKL